IIRPSRALSLRVDQTADPSGGIEDVCEPGPLGLDQIPALAARVVAVGDPQTGRIDDGAEPAGGIESGGCPSGRVAESCTATRKIVGIRNPRAVTVAPAHQAVGSVVGVTRAVRAGVDSKGLAACCIEAVGRSPLKGIDRLS